MEINIDNNAGFCWGVVQTVEKVEEELLCTKSGKVAILGEIIHNPQEIQRLSQKGLKTVSLNDLDNISKEEKIVIRAHGEPPSTYKLLEDKGFNYTDATCPLVKSLQRKVQKYYLEGYQILIFGKRQHAEVVGLRGVCDDNCIVIKSKKDENLELVDLSKKTVLFSQTTMNRSDYLELSAELKSKFTITNGNDELYLCQDTICKYVNDRETNLRKFAGDNDLIIFTAGKNSSNGKSLFSICYSENPNTIFIESYDEIIFSEIKNYKKIGITGATSTPQWYLEKVKEYIFQQLESNQT